MSISVDHGTLKLRQTLVSLTPWPRDLAIASIFSADSAGGRPPRRPHFTAALSPALTRSRMVRHPRWTFHFVPTSCSWLNAVGGFFAKPTRRRLKNGVFHSVVDLQATINRFIMEHNQEPRPFVWKADPDEIIAAVKRGRKTLGSIH